mmetsp:Transcript_19692/g.62625  ORF Transcript_19692/g.62625 Transcript_19692/m.62625 type:complete len:359 (+) Transcript_19692:88-1164(+)
MGFITDNYGRKTSTLCSLGIMCSCIIGSILSPSYWAYVFFRAMSAVGCGSLAITSYVLCTESACAVQRERIGVVFNLYWAGGSIAIATLAKFLSGWRALSGGILAIEVLIFVGIAGLIHESPRWLQLSRGTSHAIDVVEKICARNSSELPVMELESPEGGGSKTEDSKARWKALTNPTNAFRLAILGFVGMSMCMAYYGWSLNVGNMGGDIFLNAVLVALVEVPGYALAGWLISSTNVGRRTLVSTTLLGAALCQAFTIVAPQHDAIVVPLAKLAISMTYCVWFTYMGELFPTVIRSTASGVVHLSEGVGSTLMPFVLALSSVSVLLPKMIFAVLLALGSLCIRSFLPETRGTNLNDV